MGKKVHRSLKDYSKPIVTLAERKKKENELRKNLNRKTFQTYSFFYKV